MRRDREDRWYRFARGVRWLAMRDLEPGAREALLARIGAILRCEEQTDDLRSGYHREGVFLLAGTLYYHPESPVDTVVHEAAHAILLDEEQRERHVGDAIPSGGGWGGGESDALLSLQVELCRSVSGLGRLGALAAMEEIGYFPDGAMEWWRGGGREAAKQWREAR